MPRVHDGALFVATNDSLTPDQPDLFRLNLETGDTIWSKKVRGGPRNSDSLLRWDPDPGEGVWHATEETELSG